MDERTLSELLRDAVADAPPPTFDQHDVARESERQRLRTRNGILTGSALGVALLAGATALSVALWAGSNSAEQSNAAVSADARGNADTAPNELDGEGGAAAPGTDGGQGGGDDSNSSPESRKQGRTSAEGAGPAGPGSTPSGCEQADRELAAALAGELPAAAIPDEPQCEPNLTSASFTLSDGVLTVMLLDQGTMLGSADEAGMVTEQAQATTADGRTVVLFSAAPSPGPPPYADELDDVARRIAAHDLPE